MPHAPAAANNAQMVAAIINGVTGHDGLQCRPCSRQQVWVAWQRQHLQLSQRPWPPWDWDRASFPLQPQIRSAHLCHATLWRSACVCSITGRSKHGSAHHRAKPAAAPGVRRWSAACQTCCAGDCRPSCCPWPSTQLLKLILKHFGASRRVTSRTPNGATSGYSTGRHMRPCKPQAPALHLPQAWKALAPRHPCKQHLCSTNCRQKTAAFQKLTTA